MNRYLLTIKFIDGTISNATLITDSNLNDVVETIREALDEEVNSIGITTEYKATIINIKGAMMFELRMQDNGEEKESDDLLTR